MNGPSPLAGSADGDIQEIRDDMERAKLRKLQPGFISMFFIEALRRFGGRIVEREKGRFEITRVPGIVRQRAKLRTARGRSCTPGTSGSPSRSTWLMSTAGPGRRCWPTAIRCSKPWWTRSSTVTGRSSRGGPCLWIPQATDRSPSRAGADRAPHQGRFRSGRVEALLDGRDARRGRIRRDRRRPPPRPPPDRGIRTGPRSVAVRAEPGSTPCCPTTPAASPSPIYAVPTSTRSGERPSTG